MSDSEIMEILEIIKPKLKKVLHQTSSQNSEDLEQDLTELIIKKIKSNTLKEVPGLFEFIDQYTSKSD